MKKITMVVAICAMALAACKKDNSTKYFMSANVDGETFYIDTQYEYMGNISEGVYCIKESANPGYIKIAASALNPQYGIEFDLDSSYTGVGTYDLKVIDEAIYYKTLGDNWQVGAAYPTSSGTLVITSDANGVIQGTFSMNAACVAGCDSITVKHITDGKFSIPITLR